MITGTTATYYDGVEFVATAPPPHASFESAGGVPDKAWPTIKGIRVQDFRETRLWGLLRRGGWRIEGGLLARVPMDAGTLELYGKSVWRTRPTLFHFGISPPRSAEHSYEFFLLYRATKDAKAAVLKKWTIPPGQIPYDYIVRGMLRYDATRRLATVTVSGFDDKRVFLDEGVELSSEPKPSAQ